MLPKPAFALFLGGKVKKGKEGVSIVKITEKLFVSVNFWLQPISKLA